MENFEQGIIDYIKLPKTEYAIQIDGAWGSGKTFYVKNKLFETIDEFYNRNKEKYKICYISLNGIAKVDEIGESVFFEMTEAKNKFGVQGVKMLANYGTGLTTLLGLGPLQGVTEKVIKDTLEHIEKNIKKIEKDNGKEIIIFIDDLERKSEKVTISEVLGYIYTNYIENQLAKVIFITNENEILEKEEYGRLKEKIIDKSLFFEQPSWIVLQEIIYSTFEKDGEFVNFIKQNEKDVFESINVIFSKPNLRTIRYAFDNFNIVFNYTKKIIENEKHFSYVTKFLLINVLIVSKEYKEGNIKEKKDLSFIYGYNIYYSKHRKADNSIINDFTSKYFEKTRFIDEYKYFFETITGLIIEGYLSNSEYKKEVLEFLKIKRENIHLNFELEPIQIITNYKYYTEDKVKRAQEDIEFLILNNKYSAIEYPPIYQEFLIMKKLDLIFLEKDIEDLFKKGFYQALEKWHPKDYEKINENYTKLDPLIQEMIENLKIKVYHYQDIKRKEVVEEWLEKLLKEENDEELFGKVENVSELFEVLENINVVNKYIIKNRKIPIRLNTMIYHKYLKNPEKNVFSLKELRHLNYLITQLKKVCDEQEIDKIYIHNLRVLIQEMEKIQVLKYSDER